MKEQRSSAYCRYCDTTSHYAFLLKRGNMAQPLCDFQKTRLLPNLLHHYNRNNRNNSTGTNHRRSCTGSCTMGSTRRRFRKPHPPRRTSTIGLPLILTRILPRRIDSPLVFIITSTLRLFGVEITRARMSRTETENAEQ